MQYRHGSPYDRGSADAYYNRLCKPHYFIGATYQSQRIDKDGMTDQEILEYYAGYRDQQWSGDQKEY